MPEVLLLYSLEVKTENRVLPGKEKVDSTEVLRFRHGKLWEEGFAIASAADRLGTETQACQHLVTWTFPVADLCASDAEFSQLSRTVLGMTPEADWEAVGGFASFIPDPANRRFTLVHKQSSQDRVLYFLTQQRLARRGR